MGLRGKFFVPNMLRSGVDGGPKVNQVSVGDLRIKKMRKCDGNYTITIFLMDLFYQMSRGYRRFRREFMVIRHKSPCGTPGHRPMSANIRKNCFG